MPWHAVGPEAAARRHRQYFRRATGRDAALLRKRTDARARRADGALSRLCPEPLPSARRRHAIGATGISGGRTRAAEDRAARAVEQCSSGAVSRLDLAAPA